MVELRLFGMLAAALTLLACAPSAYASVVYDFSFDNASNGGGTVQGTITLPSSADGAYTASSVVVTSNTAGFGLGQYFVFFNEITEDQFVVSGGDITSGTVTIPTEFLDFGESNRLPGVKCCSLEFNVFDSIVDGGLSDSGGTVTDGPGSPVTFTLATTPIPATLPLFAAGLAGLGLLGWRTKRKMQAVAA
jgi:hypothetical protein